MFYRPLFAFVMVVISLALVAASASGQARTSARFSQLSSLDPCANEPDGSGTRHVAPRSVVSYLRSASECDVPETERSGVYDDPPVRRADSWPVQPSGLVYAELSMQGSAGFLVAAARQQVLQILAEHSSCSAWYAQAEENPQRKFASLHYRIDEGGESAAFAEQKPFGLANREPYVARTQQDVGAGSIITLNAHGAFFQERAPFKVHLNDGAPLVERSLVYLHVAGYPGGSGNAQVATLLHEYAHIVGLLPIDFGAANSADLSTQNTSTVLQHCRRQIEASSKRAVVLPASFQGLGSRHKSN